MFRNAGKECFQETLIELKEEWKQIARKYIKSLKIKIVKVHQTQLKEMEDTYSTN